MDIKHGTLLGTLLILGACGGPAGDAAAPTAMGTDSPVVAPAIISPSEVADPTEPPSYEVAIASAAATRNKGKDRCAGQPEAVRAQCEQEANAAFDDSQASLQHLRGNQP